ncbi:MAG TPA: hypothetical protein VFY73_01340 [Ideonella sp.]|uniref:hypothetical protein n=1 Tax=Ideonella sp. TaxID=1929293 RepID=UPI002E32EDDD|nr:hypothetical protein [Ideonella sp.]HEX5682651.1 hypothetical protein [Ideonella sp.]
MNALFADMVTSETSQPASQPPRRSAALLLHSLSDTDRAWALSQLDSGARDALRPLLDELLELGVPRDPVWVRQVLAESAPSPSGRMDAIHAPRERIANADPQSVASLLLREPRGLVQRVLAMGPWPWTEAVRAALKLHRGDLFEPSVVTPRQPTPKGSALEQALLAQLTAALDKMSPSHRAIGPANGVRPSLAQRFSNLLAGRHR